jgi:uncharacterized protein
MPFRRIANEYLVSLGNSRNRYRNSQLKNTVRKSYIYKYNQHNMNQQQSYWESGFKREGVEPGTYKPTDDERTLAILCHALGIFFWILPPLIIYLWKKDDSPYVAEHAKEAFNFQLTLGIITVILFVTLIGIIFLWVPWIMDLVFCIIAALKASENKLYRYPLTIRLLK